MVGKPIMDKNMLNNRKMCAMRGRMHNESWTQQFEIRDDGISNTITSISKDYYTIGRWVNMDTQTPKVEDYLYKDYGIFKLSPRETGRLMAVKDSDIDKMAAVNSNTRLYMSFGNSIVVTVLMALFSQLNIKGVPVWNSMTEEERQALTDSVRDWDDRCKASN